MHSNKKSFVRIEQKSNIKDFTKLSHEIYRAEGKISKLRITKETDKISESPYLRTEGSQ